MEAPLFDLDLPHSSPQVSRVSIAIVLVFLAIGLIGFGYVTLQSTESTQAHPTLPQASSFSPVQTIAVDVQGAVLRPGVLQFTISFDEEVRLATVIEKAGGFSPTANTDYIAKQINQASFVRDGQKIYIPFMHESESILGEQIGSKTIHINTASLTELMTLEGIGKGRGEAIMKSRPYIDIDDLQKRARLSKNLIEEIKDEISF